MKNLLKSKRRQFNSKKGVTLVELIVAIMILLIVISATVRGLSVSYRSAMMGGVKNDAQSVAQRNCDIIMASIVSIAENNSFATATDQATLGGNFVDRVTHCEITSNFNNAIEDDAKMEFQDPAGGTIQYDQGQYATLKPVDGNAQAVEIQKNADKTASPGLKYQYYTISRKTDQVLNQTPNPGAALPNSYQIYTVTTYVYYTDNAFVTCEGEVCVQPKP